jgi:UPF0755 protein
MTIRGGGRPRDDRSQAHPENRRPHPDEHLAFADARSWQPYGVSRARNGRKGQHGGIFGLVRFLAFALVLAAAVLAVMLTALRPFVGGAVAGWAYDNPGALRIPFVADMVRESLGPELTDPVSDDPSEIPFAVVAGDTPEAIAGRLVDQGLLKNEHAFIFEATLQNLTPQLKEGNFRLASNMTPGQLVTGLINNQIIDTSFPLTFREGLRLEQMTAKLQTLGPPVAIDPKEFYDLAKHPPASLLGQYPWLRKAGLPKGASLEGFLYPATYKITPDTKADDLIRMMLDAFQENIGSRMDVPKSRGLSFYKVVVLASLVEREVKVDKERPLIAGVYQNRLDPDKWPTGLLQADPTVIYGVDTINLGPYSTDWQKYSFWNVPAGGMKEQVFPDALAGYQSYQTKGIPPGPICTPTVGSIDAALHPNTKTGYLFFVAIPNDDGEHAFAKTKEEHDANLRKYGYQ